MFSPGVLALILVFTCQSVVFGMSPCSRSSLSSGLNCSSSFKELVKKVKMGEEIEKASTVAFGNLYNENDVVSCYAWKLLEALFDSGHETEKILKIVQSNLSNGRVCVASFAWQFLTSQVKKENQCLIKIAVNVACSRCDCYQKHRSFVIRSCFRSLTLALLEKGYIKIANNILLK